MVTQVRKICQITNFEYFSKSFILVQCAEDGPSFRLFAGLHRVRPQHIARYRHIRSS